MNKNKQNLMFEVYFNDSFALLIEQNRPLEFIPNKDSHYSSGYFTFKIRTNSCFIVINMKNAIKNITFLTTRISHLYLNNKC